MIALHAGRCCPSLGLQSVQLYLQPCSSVCSRAVRDVQRYSASYQTVVRNVPLDALTACSTSALGHRSLSAPRAGLARCNSTGGSTAAISQPQQQDEEQKRTPDASSPPGFSAQHARIAPALAVALQWLRHFRWQVTSVVTAA